MNPLIRQVIGEDKNDDETRTYTIRARADHLDELEKFFAWVNHTRSGHSGAAELAVDGDGAARVEIKRQDGDLPDDWEERLTHDGSPELKVCLEGANENAVIVRQRPVDYYVCPHCHEEIHEKGSYSDDGGETLKHGKCGGVIEYPETRLAPWLRSYAARARAKREPRKVAPRPKSFTVGDTTASSLL